jgi:hypothetical protein
MSARSKILGSVAIVALAAVGYVAPASAVPVNCIDTTHDYMKVDSSLVSSCLAAGVGNIGQSGGNDPFLNAHSGWTNIGEGAWTQLTRTGQTTGHVHLRLVLLGRLPALAIGFKFGTGNQPDEWFVYTCSTDLLGGWTFHQHLSRMGGVCRTS